MEEVTGRASETEFQRSLPLGTSSSLAGRADPVSYYASMSTCGGLLLFRTT